LIVNAGEAAALFKEPIDRLATRVSAWRRSLVQKKVSHLIVTRGPEPTLCITAEDYLEVPGLRVKPVDTVGAGDAFAGAFAASWAKGTDLLTAIRYANCAGGLATLKPGAQESIPNLTETKKAVFRLQKARHPRAQDRRSRLGKVLSRSTEK
jgi:ribokinase